MKSCLSYQVCLLPWWEYLHSNSRGAGPGEVSFQPKLGLVEEELFWSLGLGVGLSSHWWTLESLEAPCLLGCLAQVLFPQGCGHRSLAKACVPAQSVWGL